ncbi:Hsp20/alpha crystallin family protein [Xanthobacter autotrophicus DSM 597]|uniref:Hsp20/alpha crystallin family protein n=1 Tax=Xanthobacter TaxID=279 RepID=UPI001AE29998|nr:Hsp20/alpha crystallin family protein [Xanthobacter flavus]MBP2150048.1 HSP20 family protein [Xanthobacter flavus]
MAETKIPVKIEPKSTPVAAAAPATPFDHLRREIEQVFDNFRIGTLGFPFARRVMDFDFPRLGALTLAPAVDVAEREGAYEISAELPGLDEKDVEVKLANGLLTIRGEKKEEREEKEKDYYLSERRYGAFTRSFQVPEGVDADKVEARFAKGVLTVTLPKTAEAQKQEKKIEVKAA